MKSGWSTSSQSPIKLRSGFLFFFLFRLPNRDGGPRLIAHYILHSIHSAKNDSPEVNEPNVVNREVILEQVADKGLFVICIRSLHLFILSRLFLSFTLLFVVLSTTSASPSRVLNFQDGVALLFSSFIPWFSTFCRSKMLQWQYFELFDISSTCWP